jgi:hypothetical protein
MRKFVLAAGMSILSAAAAAATPDFSGNWVLDAGKSKNLGMMSTMDYQSRIKQTADALIVRDDTQMMGQTQSRETRYLLNGTPASNVSYMGDPAKTASHWNGSKLVTAWTTAGAVAGTTTVRTETRSLSADGKTMTVESTNGSKPPIVFVFDRQ